MPNYHNNLHPPASTAYSGFLLRFLLVIISILFLFTTAFLFSKPSLFFIHNYLNKSRAFRCGSPEIMIEFISYKLQIDLPTRISYRKLLYNQRIQHLERVFTFKPFLEQSTSGRQCSICKPQ